MNIINFKYLLITILIKFETFKIWRMQLNKIVNVYKCVKYQWPCIGYIYGLYKLHPL